MPVGEVPERVPYYERIEPAAYRERIAARQAAVADRMLG
jgi:hypothetical protein